MIAEVFMQSLIWAIPLSTLFWVTLVVLLIRL